MKLFVAAQMLVVAILAANVAEAAIRIESRTADGGVVKSERHVLRRAAGSRGFTWQSLPAIPWAPPYPDAQQQGVRLISVEGAGFPAIMAAVHLSDATPVKLARRSAIMCSFSIRGKYPETEAQRRDDAGFNAFDESGIEAAAIEGDGVVLFDVKSHEAIAARMHVARIVSHALWRAEKDDARSEADVAWAEIP